MSETETDAGSDSEGDDEDPNWKLGTKWIGPHCGPQLLTMTHIRQTLSFLLTGKNARRKTKRRWELSEKPSKLLTGHFGTTRCTWASVRRARDNLTCSCTCQRPRLRKPWNLVAKASWRLWMWCHYTSHAGCAHCHVSQGNVGRQSPCCWAPTLAFILLIWLKWRQHPKLIRDNSLASLANCSLEGSEVLQIMKPHPGLCLIRWKRWEPLDGRQFNV